MTFTSRSSAVRLLLVACVLATAVGTHWVDRTGPVAARIALGRLPGGATEMARATEWLNGYYASADGLQRPNGLWTDGRPDAMAIGTWLFDRYLRARLGGASEEDARAAVIEGIRQSPEWQAKHPAQSASR